MRPGLRRRTFAQVDTAYFPVSIRFGIDVPDPLGALAQGCHGFDLGQWLVKASDPFAQQRNVHIAGLAECLGQALVILGVGVRLAEDHVEQHAPGLGRGQPVEQVGVHGPRPGPLAELLQAVVVDGHDENARVDWQRAQALQVVVQQVAQGQAVAQGQDRRQRQQDQADP